VAEAFQLFDITKEKFRDYPPYLTAAIVQKIAVKTKDSSKSKHEITSTNEYKAMVK
jgi:hypothetical protein